MPSFDLVSRIWTCFSVWLFTIHRVVVSGSLFHVPNLRVMLRALESSAEQAVPPEMPRWQGAGRASRYAIWLATRPRGRTKQSHLTMIASHLLVSDLPGSKTGGLQQLGFTSHTWVVQSLVAMPQFTASMVDKRLFCLLVCLSTLPCYCSQGQGSILLLSLLF